MTDYLPKNATIEETCEWLQHQTEEKWTLPRLLEDGHLRPYVWIDYVEGLPQMFGDRLEGYLTEMVFHGDVVRLAADRNEALLTMFTAHDGALIRPKPGWRVSLKDIRFKHEQVKRVAEIINKQKIAPAQDTATPAPVVNASDGPETLPAVPNWKMRIQTEAAELFLRLLASGANPTPHSLVKPMAKWCRDNEIKTDGNINPSEGYIRTHVLGGDHWTPPNMSREQAKKHVAQVAQTKVAQVAQ